MRIETEPKVILKSWWPEFKEFPDLKPGETKVIFTQIPAFNYLPIRDNEIDLICPSNTVSVENTLKENQFIVIVSDTVKTLNEVELEVWFTIGNKVILLKNGSGWVDIRNEYLTKDDKILIQKVKLKISS